MPGLRNQVRKAGPRFDRSGRARVPFMRPAPSESGALHVRGARHRIAQGRTGAGVSQRTVLESRHVRDELTPRFASTPRPRAHARRSDGSRDSRECLMARGGPPKAMKTRPVAALLYGRLLSTSSGERPPKKDNSTLIARASRPKSRDTAKSRKARKHASFS